MYMWEMGILNCRTSKGQAHEPRITLCVESQNKACVLGNGE